MSSPLMRWNVVVSVEVKGVGSSDLSNRPLMSGLRAAGTLSIPSLCNIFSMWGP